MYSCTRIIHERNKNIPIQQLLSKNMKHHHTSSEYSLTHNFFDPSQSSPPNDFMIKLQARMTRFNTSQNVINDDSRDSE